MSGSNLLVVVTGSIAAYKGCDVISQLVQRGHRVRCVLTEAGARFIGAATLEGLTGTPVQTDLFAGGQAMDHINLTRWADGVLVCPATANTLNRLAAGLADDLLGALFLAHDRSKPWLVAPAMNPAMWSHPATESTCRKLTEWGVRVLPVGDGRTACGESGEGRLLEPARIVAAVEASLARPAVRRRILVTAGGTAEPVDGVRVLTNLSTGVTGASIADRLAFAGHDVVLLRAHHAASAQAPCREVPFGTFAELDAALRDLLARETFHAVIHAAAVSDYHVAAVEDADTRPAAPGKGRKLASGRSPVLRLRPNPRLVDGLRALSPTPFLLVAFKLTHGADPAAAAQAVHELFEHSAADFVVHNDHGTRLPDGAFPADIYQRDGSVRVHCVNRAALATALADLVTGGEATVIPLPCS